MATVVRLTVLTGQHKKRRYCFRAPIRCQVGRAQDCFVHFSGTERDEAISRHHCQLDIDPPGVEVRDFGSRNGTYVNGKEVGPSLEALSEASGFVINDGDLITVGGTTMRVDVLDCSYAGDESKDKSIWAAEEIAKKDCPMPC
jgi:hypothetical protein